MNDENTNVQISIAPKMLSDDVRKILPSSGLGGVGHMEQDWLELRQKWRGQKRKKERIEHASNFNQPHNVDKCNVK